MYDVPVSELQTGITVGTDAITGTLKYLSDSNAITDLWGDGNFLALKFTNMPIGATSVKVGLRPTYGGPGGTTPIDDDSGLVEIINDPDLNGIFMINDKSTQDFKIVVTDGVNTVTKTYDLSGLTCELF